MRRALAVLLAAAGLSACGWDPARNATEAAGVVSQRLSMPGEAVATGPAVAEADFAIVGWTRGPDAGGRVLLRRANGAWTVVLCGGAPLRRRPIVERQGRVPDIAAGILITKLWREEGGIDPGRRARLDQGTAVAGCVEAHS